MCEHGIPMRCLERHAEGDPRIGQALCPACYDYEAATLWNANLGALWRRTITYLPRELAALSGLSVAALRAQVRVAYAKVAEFQARASVHVHAVIRLDGPDGPTGRHGRTPPGSTTRRWTAPNEGAVNVAKTSGCEPTDGATPFASSPVNPAATRK